MQVSSLGRENSLWEGTATRSSVLAWKTPWTEEPGGLQSIESQRVRHDLAHTHAHKSISSHGISPTLGPYIFNCLLDVRTWIGGQLQKQKVPNLSSSHIHFISPKFFFFPTSLCLLIQSTLKPLRFLPLPCSHTVLPSTSISQPTRLFRLQSYPT